MSRLNAKNNTGRRPKHAWPKLNQLLFPVTPANNLFGISPRPPREGPVQPDSTTEPAQTKFVMVERNNPKSQ